MKQALLKAQRSTCQPKQAIGDSIQKSLSRGKLSSLQSAEATQQAARIARLESELQEAKSILNDIIHSPLFLGLESDNRHCASIPKEKPAYQDWTTSEVEVWIRSLGLPKAEVSIFVSQGIPGRLLPRVSEINLVAVGMSLGTALQIVEAISKLVGISKWISAVSDYNNTLYGSLLIKRCS